MFFAELSTATTTGEPTTLAALAILATAVAGIIWLSKYFAKTLAKDLQEHTKAAVELTAAAREQKKASNEVLIFMKRLNGKLEGAVIQKVAEKTEERRIYNKKKG